MGKSPTLVNITTPVIAAADNDPPSSSSTNADPAPPSVEAPPSLDVPLPSISRPASTHSQPPPPYTHPRHNRVAERVTNSADTVRQRQDSRRLGIVFRSISLLCDVLAVALFSACLVKSYSIYTDGYSGSISAMGLGGVSPPIPPPLTAFAAIQISFATFKPTPTSLPIDPTD